MEKEESVKPSIDNVQDITLVDTGERMIPAHHRGHMVYGEHLVRYRSAQQLVAGKIVLDVASGSGYGSALLGDVASRVFGVDVDAGSVAYATENYGSERVSFQEGSATAIPLGEGSVDVVVSFETIEHIEDYRKFMSEIKRVLRADGILLLSTPNDVEFPESNHFHLHEFEQHELNDLIKESFSETKWFFQGTWLYTALFSEAELGSRWTVPITTMSEAPIPPVKAIYFFVICANRVIKENLNPVATIAEHWSARQIQEYEDSVRGHIDEQKKIMNHLENEVQKAMERKNLLELRYGRLNKLYELIIRHKK